MRYTAAETLSDVWRDRKVSDFALIFPPGVGTTVYQGLEHRGKGGGT